MTNHSPVAGFSHVSVYANRSMNGNARRCPCSFPRGGRTPPTPSRSPPPGSRSPRRTTTPTPHAFSRTVACADAAMDETSSAAATARSRPSSEAAVRVGRVELASEQCRSRRRDDHAHVLCRLAGLVAHHVPPPVVDEPAALLDDVRCAVRVVVQVVGQLAFGDRDEDRPGMAVPAGVRADRVVVPRTTTSTTDFAFTSNSTGEPLTDFTLKSSYAPCQQGRRDAQAGMPSSRRRASPAPART